MKIIVLCLTVLFGIAAVRAKPVQFLAAYEDAEQPPYYMGNSREVLDKPGVAVEMVMLLSAYLPQLRIELRRAPWSRCLKELEAGRVDAVFNASFKTERLELGVYPMKDGQPDVDRRITTLAYSLYKRQDSKVSWDGEKIIHLDGKVGAPSGYSIVEDLQRMGIAVDEAQATRVNLLKLKHGRVAAVAAQEVTADAIIQAEPDVFGGIVKLRPPLASKPYYLMLSRQFTRRHPALAEQIWDALARIREERLDELMRKYAD